MTWFVVTLPDSTTQEFALSDKSKGQDLLDAVSSASLYTTSHVHFPKLTLLYISHTSRFARNSRLFHRTILACNTTARKANNFGWTDETKLVAKCLVPNRTGYVFEWNSSLNHINWSKTTQGKFINFFLLCLCFDTRRLFHVLHSWSRIFAGNMLALNQNNGFHKYQMFTLIF